GLSDAALFRHHQAGASFLLNAPLPEDATGPVVEAMCLLQAMYRQTRLLPAAAAIEHVLEVTGLLARAVAATPGGAEAGDLVHALDRVRQIAESGGSLAEAAAALEQDLEAPEVESIPLEPGRQDVVRVMNLHKAKGLEAPVVFLADPLGGYEPWAEVRVVRDGAEPQGYFRIINRWGDRGIDLLAEPAGWADHEAVEQVYVDAEVKRLLYVAATRAKDLLIISRWAGNKGRHQRPWQPFEPYLRAATELAVPVTVTPPRPRLGDVGAPARSAAAAARASRVEAARQPSWVVDSVTGTAHKAGPYGHPLQPGRTREPDTGVAWGSLVHALLENALRGPRRDREHLQRIASWLTVADPQLRRVVPEALDTVARVMATELWQRAMAAAERHEEVPFAARADADGLPRVLYGVIDLAFRMPAGWELIDYKTDQAELEELETRYRGQVSAYAEQWEALVGHRIAFAGLYGIRAGRLTSDLQPRPETR
ncbi:MAG: PD-(D/E)XK nuclease family protein, partial [Candidatus Rokuibacteriota bacterium]